MRMNWFGFDIEYLRYPNLLTFFIRELLVSRCNLPRSRVWTVKDVLKTFGELNYIKLKLWCSGEDYKGGLGDQVQNFNL